MVDLKDAVSLLQAKRQELTDQLASVDKALDALLDAGGAVPIAPAAAAQEEIGDALNPVCPTRLKSPRTLSDDHKHALNEGRRKARHAKAAAAGFARETTDPSPGLATASSVKGRPPRLVKRKRP